MGGPQFPEGILPLAVYVFMYIFLLQNYFLLHKIKDLQKLVIEGTIFFQIRARDYSG